MSGAGHLPHTLTVIYFKAHYLSAAGGVPFEQGVIQTYSDKTSAGLNVVAALSR